MANALKNETSPYLIQHADNPVEWQPWNEAALETARATGKPILLSIGYSACHWCHVMAHESFEDEATAELMNRLYVNIKVDREERPDLDRIYQTAQQFYTGRPGGWPLTVFLTPDEHLPIFAGTYFPKNPSHGMPAFQDVLTRVEAYYRSLPDEIRQNGAKLIAALEGLNRADATSVGEFVREPLDRARLRLGESHDSLCGGFGDAPKFPHPTNVDFLLGYWQRSAHVGEADTGALAMLERTLEKMAHGGLYDHLGGGFFRYCVDRQWTIPHFEKMLYDNAALLATYADAYASLGHAWLARVASETADWMLRDLGRPDGGFYATLDADSEGHEGKFYVWTVDEIDALLNPEEAEAVKTRFGLDRAPNFEDTAWHLTRAQASAGSDASESLEHGRAKLLAARDARVWPGRDEKLLVAWNGMAIGALAKAARRLGRPELADAACRAVDFIRDNLWRDGRLKASYKDGRARFNAYLDDYSFLGAGLIELLQCRWRSKDLDFARELAEVLLDRYADEAGGFFFTADDHERLIHRPKPLADEAIPAGNAVAALLLDDLGHLLGEPRYLEASERALGAAWPLVERYPDAHASLLRVLERQLKPPILIVVRGDPSRLQHWREGVDQSYHPHRLGFFIPDDVDPLPGLLAERAAGDSPVAYVCEGTACREPIRDLEEFLAGLVAAR